MEINPERLGTADVPAAMTVLREAFAAHPMLPPGTPARATERLMKLMVDTFGRHETAALHGLYLKEGFVTVAEVPSRSLVLCHMRRDKN